ncbi:MAG: GGDEF domain-containing protein, partial [Gammaproteobacteria bacterium]|nr:GGDEF domain-containing protein [Gammaproteobacteria bacterium]
MNYLHVKSSRIRIARLFLLFGMGISLIAALSNIHIGMNGEALGALVSILLTPIILWLGNKPALLFLPNIAAVLISFGFSVGSAFTVLHHSAGLVWLGIIPIMYFYLTNRFIGLTLSGITLAVYFIAYFFYSDIHDIAPVPLGVMGQAIAVFLYATLLAWLYETEWSSIESKLLKYSDHDFLTGIYNRRAIIRHIEMSISNFERNHAPFSIILFDLDNFKMINDNYGHEIGDHVLKETVLALQSSIRSGDIIGRWGGEEFVVICNNSLNNSHLFAAKLCDTLSNHKYKYLRHLQTSFVVTHYLKN